MIQAGRRQASSHRHDGYGGRGGYATVVPRAGCGRPQMLQPLAIAVIGGILISMVLSLIITPAIEYYLTRDKEAAVSGRHAGRRCGRGWTAAVKLIAAVKRIIDSEPGM